MPVSSHLVASYLLLKTRNMFCFLSHKHSLVAPFTNCFISKSIQQSAYFLYLDLLLFPSASHTLKPDRKVCLASSTTRREHKSKQQKHSSPEKWERERERVWCQISLPLLVSSVVLVSSRFHGFPIALKAPNTASSLRGPDRVRERERKQARLHRWESWISGQIGLRG